MKRIAIILTALLLVLTFAACGSGEAEAPKISAEEALNIALNEAGVTPESVRNLENRLERENGVAVYEIDFKSGILEYSYDVNAETGAVTESDREIDD